MMKSPVVIIRDKHVFLSIFLPPMSGERSTGARVGAQFSLGGLHVRSAFLNSNCLLPWLAKRRGSS